MKKIIFFSIFLILLFSCSHNVEDTQADNRLVIWSFSKELGEMATYYQKTHPEVEVVFLEFSNSGTSVPYISQVNQAIRKGVGAPDVFAGEIDYVRSLVELGYWEDLSAEPYGAEEIASNQFTYAADLGRDINGNLRALTWQATPGALFYRRSLAKKFFGTDDPKEISKLTGNWDSLFKMAETIKDETNGEVSLVASVQDLARPVINTRKNQWIVDNKVQLEQPLIDFMDRAKEITDKSLLSQAFQWSGGWYEKMNDKTVFAYILPTWGLNHVLRPSSPDGVGDWGLASPPTSYFQGGTWIGISKKSREKDLAWDFVKYITSNEEFLEEWATEKGDFLAYLPVVEKIKTSISEPFLAGQNHYQYFYEEAGKIDASNVGQYDNKIYGAYWSSISLYTDGLMSKEEAIENFKTSVQNLVPGVEIE